MAASLRQASHVEGQVTSQYAVKPKTASPRPFLNQTPTLVARKPLPTRCLHTSMTRDRAPSTAADVASVTWREQRMTSLSSRRRSLPLQFGTYPYVISKIPLYPAHQALLSYTTHFGACNRDALSTVEIFNYFGPCEQPTPRAWRQAMKQCVLGALFLRGHPTANRICMRAPQPAANCTRADNLEIDRRRSNVAHITSPLNVLFLVIFLPLPSMTSTSLLFCTHTSSLAYLVPDTLWILYRYCEGCASTSQQWPTRWCPFTSVLIVSSRLLLVSGNTRTSSSPCCYLLFSVLVHDKNDTLLFR